MTVSDLEKSGEATDVKVVIDSHDNHSDGEGNAPDWTPEEERKLVRK